MDISKQKVKGLKLSKDIKLKQDCENIWQNGSKDKWTWKYVFKKYILSKLSYTEK